MERADNVSPTLSFLGGSERKIDRSESARSVAWWVLEYQEVLKTVVFPRGCTLRVRRGGGGFQCCVPTKKGGGARSLSTVRSQGSKNLFSNTRQGGSKRTVLVAKVAV